MIAILLALAIAAPERSGQSSGQVKCDPEFPTHCSAPIVRGQPSLLDGQVLTPDLAIFLGQRANETEAMIRAERERLNKLHQIDLTLERAIAEANLKASTASVAAQRRVGQYWEDRALRSEQRLAEGPPWYEHPIFVAGVTATVILVVVGIVAGEFHVIQGLDTSIGSR